MHLGVSRVVSPASLLRNKGDYTWVRIRDFQLKTGQKLVTAANNLNSVILSPAITLMYSCTALQLWIVLPIPSYFTRQFPNSSFNIAENISPGNKKIKHSIFTFRSYSINHLTATTTCKIS